MIFELKNKKISELLEKKLEINEKTKEKYGEVNTPESLIEQMLDKIPEKVWKDPNKTWLDPSTGIGSFQILVYERLIKSLASWEPDLQKRQNHILGNMLYMCEINPKNIMEAKKIFGEKANIEKCDFLESEYPNFNIKEYDIILGNPPFNANQESDGKKGGGNSLWPDFVDKSLSLLNKNGILAFVHPSGWRKPTKKEDINDSLFKKMTRDHQIQYLEIHNKTDGLKLFGVQTRYDWYILINTPCLKKTIIHDETGKTQELDLRLWDFLPNCYFTEIKRLLSNKHNTEIIYSRNQYGTDKEWTNEKESKEYKYPLIHSTPIGETRYYWTNTKTPSVKNSMKMFGIPKIIFGESGINNAILDNSGKYGITQGAIGIKIDNKKHGIFLKTALESKEFERILKALNFGNFRIDWRIFLYFRKDFYKFYLKKTKYIKKSSKKNRTIKKL